MSMSAQRYIGGAVGFAFAAVWAMAGIGSALICLVAAALGYTAVRLAEGRRSSAIAAVRELQSRRAGRSGRDRAGRTPASRAEGA